MFGTGTARSYGLLTMLVCRNIAAGYTGVAVLRDMSFCVRPGEIVGLLGPNGSGKSTLLLCLSGALRPLSGSVELGGVTLSSFSAKERARKIAFVPQRAAYIPDLTVRELVLMGRYPYLSFFSDYTEEDKRIAEEAMREVGVFAFSRRRITELSGGELQRTFLACALAQKTEILLLDEATAGLDLSRSMEIFAFLHKRAVSGNSAQSVGERQCVVAAIHDLNLAAMFCDRLIFLKHGRIMADGPTSSVFERELLETIYETRITVFKHPVIGCPQMLPCPK